MKIKNAYVEITNACNLSCSFCPGHLREKRFMSAEEFGRVASELNGRVTNLFLHLMGEPLLHPALEDILDKADNMTVSVKITTNGTLLEKTLPILIKSKNLKTVCISLHSFEANSSKGEAETKIKERFDGYLSSCFACADKLAAAEKFAVFRLWNVDSEKKSEGELNSYILDRLHRHYCKDEWVDTHRGSRIANRIFLEWGEKFDWPDISEEDQATVLGEPDNSPQFCHGLLSQIGILCDGTVVPCCLDRNGTINFGNIFDELDAVVGGEGNMSASAIERILSSPRAKKMREALAKHKLTEPLCLSCPARARFVSKKN